MFVLLFRMMRFFGTFEPSEMFGCYVSKLSSLFILWFQLYTRAQIHHMRWAIRLKRTHQWSNFASVTVITQLIAKQPASCIWLQFSCVLSLGTLVIWNTRYIYLSDKRRFFGAQRTKKEQKNIVRCTDNNNSFFKWKHLKRGVELAAFFSYTRMWSCLSTMEHTAIR